MSDTEPRTRHEPTIADVARQAGVSKGTVSHVISGRVPVKAETRARVERAIAALDYRPAETARSLTARKRPADAEWRPDGSAPRLTTVGFVNVDYTAVLDRLPRREERRLASAINKTIGGPAANVAAIAANLGAPYAVATSLITAIGIDQDSDWAAAELANRRVSLIGPRERREGRLSRALVLVEADGRRTIISEPSRLAAVDVRRFIEATEPGPTPWWLHLEGYQVPGQIAAMPAARARGFHTSMQATGLPLEWIAQHGEALFQAFDLVVLHRESLAALPGFGARAEDGLARLSALARAAGGSWPQLVAVTLGAEGAAAVTRTGEIIRAAALPVSVVDTTGAGDTFVGALLAAWLNAAPAAEALRLACAAGSLQVTRLGAQELRPTAAELLSLITARAPAAADAPTA